ncbi:MAG TPA: hypothetical protein VH328_03215 [Burkholderiaceae bacterium]|nr:hypothetical protein [Burkholderiaceae bacterium]
MTVGVPPARAGGCPGAPPPLQTMVDAEYAFARSARGSVRQAFLAVLAEDAWVLAPGPTPARAFYESQPESPGTLEWFPHAAVVAASGDLGFTSGPYVYARDAKQSFGHFLTIWRRAADCTWRVAFDGGIAHGRQPEEAPVDAAGPAPAPTAPVAVPAADAATAFQSVAAREGLGAGLRTYARNEGFRLLLEGQPPMDLARAERQLRTRVVKTAWRAVAHGASLDATLRYEVGALAHGAYAQIWQYDPRTANWGLRVLLLTEP